MMRWINYFVVALFSVLVIAGCSDAPRRSYAVAANSWIGYAPIAYAYEKGWLKEKDIHLKWTDSLSESIVLAKNGLCDGFFSTQYEVLANEEILQKFYAVFSVDRSYGADKILSNATMSCLKSCEKIDVFMESGSVNEALLQAFLKEFNIKAKIEIHDGTQEEFVKRDLPKPALVVTYEPYASLLKRAGFSEVASSKTLQTVLIIDLFFATDTLPLEHRSFLKRQFWRAYVQLRKDPKEFYQTIQYYLVGMNYHDFLQALREIKWLPYLDAKMVSYLNRVGIKMKTVQ